MVVLPRKSAHPPECGVHSSEHSQFCDNVYRLYNYIVCAHNTLESDWESAEARLKAVSDDMPPVIAPLWSRTQEVVQFLIEQGLELAMTEEEMGKALLFVAETEGVVYGNKLPAYPISDVLNRVYNDQFMNAKILVIFASLWAEDEHGRPLDWALSQCTCPRAVPLWTSILEDGRAYMAQIK